MQRSGTEPTGRSSVSEALNASLGLELILKETRSSGRVLVDVSQVLSGHCVDREGEWNEGDRLEGICNDPGTTRAGLS